MDTFDSNKIEYQEPSPEEVTARKFTQEFLLPKISDLVAVYQYGSSVTGVRTGNIEKPPDIDLLVVTKQSGEDTWLQLDAHKQNIDLLWASETALDTWRDWVEAGYKVLHGPDLFKKE